MVGPRQVREECYLHAYSGSAKPELLVAGEGQNLAIVHTALKYYPCNYYIQAVNDAVLELAIRDDLRLEARQQHRRPHGAGGDGTRV